QAVKDAIDALKHLSDEEKTAAKQEATTAAEKARDAIGEATSTNAVNDTKTAGENALEKVEKDAQFVNDKNGAKKELETEKNRIAGLIDNVKGVDQRDKDEALEALKTALTEALDQVQASKTDEDLQAAVQDGKNAMQEILDDLRALGSGNI